MNISKTIYSCENTEFDVAYSHDVVFAQRECGDLKMQILTPIEPMRPRPKNGPMDPVSAKFARWHKEGGSLMAPPKKMKFPLIVGCPGSGWAGAEGYRYIPNMVTLAKAGFVVASIGYRGTYKDNVVFPAAVQDLREAVRFLLANAETYHIDTERVGLIGDSSGGNTVAMASLCGESVMGYPELKFDIGENLDKEINIKACCCVYGPIDLVELVDDRIAEGKRLRPDEVPGLPFEAMEIWQEQYVDDPVKRLKAASPLCYLDQAKKIPPFLYIQGDDDNIIPMAQGLRFCDKIRSLGGRAEFVKVVGGGHGTGVWSAEMLETTTKFFKTYL